MSNLKAFLVWIAVVAVCAAGTVFAVQVLEKPMGLQQRVATFGK